MDKLLYTPQEAASLLALSRSRTYELMGAGALPYVHIGRSRRIKAAALAEFVASLAPAV